MNAAANPLNPMDVLHSALTNLSLTEAGAVVEAHLERASREERSYAAFLQEAAALLQRPELDALSREMTSIGDDWREFALAASRIYKRRQSQDETYESVSTRLLRIADREAAVFEQLLKV